LGGQSIGAVAWTAPPGIAKLRAGMPRRSAPTDWLPACLVAALIALAIPSSAAATRECFLFTQCTSVTGPWVVIPAADPRPDPAGVVVTCPDHDPLLLAAGSDYELSGGVGGPPPDVGRLLPGPGAGLITGGNALFFAVALTDVSTSFRPHVGCIPQPQQAAPRRAPVEQGRARVVRTRELRLRPSRAITSSHRCRRSERLTRGLAGVLFHRRRAPTARELRDVTVTHRRLGQHVRASVRTGPTVGDRERVTLQILAVCAR
jgi:hypothetical protein